MVHRSLELTDLATKIAAWENDIPTEAVTGSQREHVYVSLYHSHVPKLVDEKVITFDELAETITATEDAEYVMAALEGIGTSLDRRQETHARGRFMAENNNHRIESDDASIGDEDSHWSQVAQRHYDPDDDLTTVIVFAIAEAEGVPSSEVKSPPLYERADVAAVEAALFGETYRQGTGTIEFRYTRYLVSVSSDGWIQVYQTNETDVQ